MGVPWDVALLQNRLRGEGGYRHPKENGITLVQLRSLQDYLKRLCKTGLLRHSSEFAAEKGLTGKALGWTLLNMHHINLEVIKKLIPSKNSCSWIQIVSSEPQKPKVYVSHNWSQPFRDFMKAIELFQGCATSQVDVGIHDPFFICTFANDQWHVDLGETLVSSPFYLALSEAQQVLLMLDKVGSALERVWCVFELKTTLEKHMPLKISTPLGLVGDRDMSTLQVMETIKATDIRRATATNEVDQRQILNNIAGVQEESGLIKDSDGKKYLEGTEKASTSSVQKYKYEEGLMNQHRAKFVQVNEFIQGHADRSVAQSGAASSGCTVEDRAGRSLTLAQLRMMARKARSYFTAPERKDWCVKNNVKDWEDITLLHIMNPFVKEYVTSNQKTSYMECVADGPQMPEYMLTEAFQMKFVEFMASLEWHAEARQLPASTTYWLLPTAMLREEADEYIQRENQSPTFEGMPYYQGQLVILNADADILKRALPSLEMLGILNQRRAIDLACPSGALAVTRPFAEGWEFGRFDPGIATHLVNFDVAKISGNVVDGCEHAEMTKCRIAGLAYSKGLKAPAWCSEYDEFNARLHAIGLGPVLRSVVERMAAYDDQSLLLKVIERSSTALTSASLHGLHGETALHISAAGGQLKAMEILVTKKANPNQQDYDGETPLHYAAMAGKLEAVEFLLSKGAVASMNSYFMETPAQVAKENPAAFLSVNTDGIADLCSTGELDREAEAEAPGTGFSFIRGLFCCSQSTVTSGDVLSVP
jgi:hypothetical protein